jgi:hypothetical protein
VTTSGTGLDTAMQSVQWIIAAITATFVALVAFLQWRTAQQKALLDLFERRHAIYEIVRNAVGTIERGPGNLLQRAWPTARKETPHAAVRQKRD